MRVSLYLIALFPLSSISPITTFTPPLPTPNKVKPQPLQTTLTPSKEKNNIFTLFEILDNLYTQSSLTIKCPFFRRRAADTIDGFAMVLRFLIIRHKSLYLDDIDTFMIKSAPPGCKRQTSLEKLKGLSVEELYHVILSDWTSYKRDDHDVGYYITGKLNTTIYRDDCLFTGPDPDMPVRGLRKYLNAASKLFHHRESFADLLELKITDNKIIAHWRIGGVIMLPWKPRIKPYTGRTEYHLDEDGLVYMHEEKWDIGVLQAFVQTMWPDFARNFWIDDDRIETSYN